jgi:hypothetical protein
MEGAGRRFGIRPPCAAARPSTRLAHRECRASRPPLSPTAPGEEDDRGGGDGRQGNEDEDPETVVPVVAVGATEEMPAGEGDEAARHQDEAPCRPATFCAVDETCVRRMPTLTGLVAMPVPVPVPNCPLVLSPQAQSRPEPSMA